MWNARKERSNISNTWWDDACKPKKKCFLKKSNFQEKGNATFLWLKQWFQPLLFQDDKTRGKMLFYIFSTVQKCMLILMSYSENGILNWPWKKFVSFVFILRLRDFAIFVPCQKFRWRKISLSKNKWGCAKQFFTYVFVYIRK